MVGLAAGVTEADVAPEVDSLILLSGRAVGDVVAVDVSSHFLPFGGSSGSQVSLPDTSIVCTNRRRINLIR